MIYITGDTHRNIKRFMHGNAEFIHDMTWTKDDVLIVCGDFGFVFYDTPEEHDMLDWFEKNKPYTICFVDGNHENHPRLAEYPLEEWHGGKIHRIRKNVIHLMRGQVFNIQGHKIFAMGGTYSIDRSMRTLGYSYWQEEIPCDAEYKEAIENLRKHNFNIDYAVTHTAPKEIIIQMGYIPDPHDYELTGFFEYVMYECKDSVKGWFFGHWHEDREIYGGKFRGLLNDVVSISQEKQS
ncbi:MAG: metallophosphoesterase [Clostridia bacterium]|nr:metallophosphoesterase [Clostridia bacterium]